MCHQVYERSLSRDKSERCSFFKGVRRICQVIDELRFVWEVVRHSFLEKKFIVFLSL